MSPLARTRAGSAPRRRRELAVLRHFALHLEERTAKGGIATKRFRAALDEVYLLTVLAGLEQGDDRPAADITGWRAVTAT